VVKKAIAICRGGGTGRPAYRQAGALDSKYMYSVYALSSLVRNYIYVGLTSDIERRVLQHQAGREKTTKSYRPFRLTLVEGYPTRPEARTREKYLKSGVGKEWLKKQ